MTLTPCETCGDPTPTDELTTFAECAFGREHCARCVCPPCDIDRGDPQ